MPPGMAPLGLFRTLAHSPRVLQRLFAGNLLDAGAISLRERELLILRTCARCGCGYEWGVHHALFARAAGLSAADIAATQAEGGTELLLRAADELHDSASISDATWSELAAGANPRDHRPVRLLPHHLLHRQRLPRGAGAVHSSWAHWCLRTATSRQIMGRRSRRPNASSNRTQGDWWTEGETSSTTARLRTRAHSTASC